LFAQHRVGDGRCSIQLTDDEILHDRFQLLVAAKDVVGQAFV